jgi:hypothetical protein
MSPADSTSSYHGNYVSTRKACGSVWLVLRSVGLVLYSTQLPLEMGGGGGKVAWIGRLLLVWK